MKTFRFLSALAAFAVVVGHAEDIPPNLRAENLAAWCIVPFDAKKRGPAERAEMLVELGIKRCAYDWRANHVKEFEEEIRQYQKHGIEFFAFWSEHPDAFALFEKYDLHPQIWRTLGSPSEGTQAEKVIAAADSMEGLAKRTAAIGCKLGLYNHGGWGGEPANLVAVCEELRKRGHEHVGIVYNWHHGHGHIDDWKESLESMKPFLHCLNLNGMNTGAKPKILTLAHGQHDAAMLKTVIESGYDGPVGILDHQSNLDAKIALDANLKGLDWLLKNYSVPGSAGKKPDLPSAVTPKPTAGHPMTNEQRKPLEPDPYWQHEINRDRVYDFYAEQALARAENPNAFPGLDGGHQGHWGNQNDQTTWKDGRVREMDHGSMVSGVFRGQGLTIPRAVSVRLGRRP